MKHSISIHLITACLLFAIGCTDVSQYQEDIADLQRRVEALEDLCNNLNNNISAIQTIATAVQNNNYITGVTPLMKSGVEIGYTITFASGDPITLYHGKDGADGTNGKDGHSPIIGVKKDADDIWYWTVDNEWLLDANGQKVKAVGTNGTTPQLKIEDDHWYISMDNGENWTKLGKAKGEDGQDATDGDSMFTHIDYTTSEDYVVFALSNGVSIQVPTWTAFDRLNRLCSQMNSNLEGLSDIVDAIEGAKYIKSFDPIFENDIEIGYVLTLNDNTKINLYHGKDGTNGKDGHSPIIGVKKDADDIWYWTVDNEWLLDANGQKVKAVGTNGTNGKDGTTPQLKIEDDYWYISMDNGENWTKLGKAKGEDGQDATDGDSMFTHIDYTTSEDYVVFALSNGVSIQVPTWTAFDRLNRLCSQMNSNLEGLSDIVDAIEGAKYIKSFDPIFENDIEIGYVLTLNDNTKINLYHGKDGTNGKDGHSPIIGVKKDADDIWYWTVDNEWLLDANGQKVKAVGTNGTNGKDGTTPQLKIEDDYWYISVDNGESWTMLGQATGDKGDAGDSFFKSVTEDDSYVYFTLTDDTVFTLPKSSVLEVSFDPDDNLTLKTGVKETISYNITSSLFPVKVEVITSSEIRATVKPSTTDGKEGKIEIISRGEIDEYSRIAVIVSNGEKVIMHTFTPIDGGTLISTGTGYIRMPARGGIADIAFITNLNYEVLIPEDAKDWISLLPSTKGLATTIRQLQIKENYFDERNATIIVRDDTNTISVDYTIVQNSVEYSAIDLGLSVKWASFNIGAKTITDAGYYYAWGDTSIKDDYDYYTYKWCYSGTNDMSKYNSSDRKTILDMEDDVANIVLGDKWRTPTYDEWIELQTECLWTWTNMKGVNGYIVASKINNNKLFLPAGGNYGGVHWYNYNSEGIYWSSSLVELNAQYAWYMKFNTSNTIMTHDYPRWEGRTIRPVTTK